MSQAGYAAATIIMALLCETHTRHLVNVTWIVVTVSHALAVYEVNRSSNLKFVRRSHNDMLGKVEFQSFYSVSS